MSFINEKAPGEFEIVKEETVPYDQSAAVVTYLNGKVDTLSPELSKKIIDDGIKNESHLNNNNLGLSNMLLYGAMGYMIGRNMNNGYMNRYREDRQRAGGTSGFYRPGAYSGSTNAIAQVENSK